MGCRENFVNHLRLRNEFIAHLNIHVSKCDPKWRLSRSRHCGLESLATVHVSSRFSESHLMITSTSALRAEPAFSSSRVGPCRSCLKRLLHCSVCKYTFRVSFFIFHDGYKFNTPQSIGAYNNTAPEWNKNWWKREKGWKRRTEKYLMLQLRDVEVLELFFSVKSASRC